MARLANTTIIGHPCKKCKDMIRDGHYATYAIARPGIYWHYNCANAYQDPDVYGFPSTKSGAYCNSNYCKAPHGSRYINVGDMIKSLGSNSFAHIQCVTGRPAYDNPPPKPNEYYSPPMPVAKLEDDIYYDGPPSPAAAIADAAAVSHSDDSELLTTLVTELASFIHKSETSKATTNSAIAALVVEQGQQNDATAGIAASMANLQVSMAELQERRPITIEICELDGSRIQRDMGYQHKQFSLLLRQAKLRDTRNNHVNILMAGPAGSGKSTSAELVAEAMGLSFDVQGVCLTQYELIGYRSPSTNELMETAFYRQFSGGGILLADELDAWDAKALLKLNGALANGLCDFPQGLVKRHKDFVLLGAANTWGHGGDSNYVGRNKLDATSKDRFLKITWPYDPIHEKHIVGTTGDLILDAATDEWVRMVQTARATAERAQAFVVISPRASLSGAAMIRAQDFTNDEIVQSVFGDLRDPKVCPAWSTIGAEFETWARQAAARTSDSNEQVA